MGRGIARFWGLAVAATMPVVLVAGGAGAIVGGSVDNGGHPNVAFVVELDQGTPVDGCTGTLISETVVVTAGHCLADRLDYAVSFESTVDFSPDEQFFGVGRYLINDRYDIALLFLSRPAAGIAPAELPDARALDGYRKGDTFTHVGYGLDSPRRKSGTAALTGYTRRTLTAELSRLSKAEIYTRSSNASLCYGDSGGPVFAGGVIVALGNYVSGNCKGTNSGPRLDIEPVQSFLKQYVG